MAAWTRASISARFRPGGIGPPNRTVTTPAFLTKEPFGQSLPLSIAIGTTGMPKAR